MVLNESCSVRPDTRFAAITPRGDMRMAGMPMARAGEEEEEEKDGEGSDGGRGERVEERESESESGAMGTQR